MAANDNAPKHYDRGQGQRQHWDDAWDQYREAWFVLNVTKYVTRYKTKDGIKDLLKAKHYLEKLIEKEQEEAKANLKTEQIYTPEELRRLTTDPKEYE